MKQIVKNIFKSLKTKKAGEFPEEYAKLLERTTEILRDEFKQAERFYMYNPTESPQQTLTLIKKHTDEVAKRQTAYKGIELYLPFHTGLYLLMRYFRPQIAMETGVERGGSTLSLLKGMYENNEGTLYSYDISNTTRFVWSDEDWQNEGRFGNMVNSKRIWLPIATLVPDWLKNRWVFAVGSSLKNVPKTLKKVKKISFFCAGHSHTYKIQKAETDNVWDSLEKGGILVIDRSDYEQDKCFHELIEKHNIPSDNYVLCKEAKFDLKFNYAIIIKP